MTNIQIDCFLGAVRNKSFSRTAKELFLSVQAVSQHISNLEQEIGMSLFFRCHEGVSLTEAGWQFLEFAEKWREMYQSMSRFLHIGVSEYLDITGPLSSGLLDFKEKHTDLVIDGQQYNNRELLQNVSDGVIDIAIMCDTQVVTGGEFEMIPFAKEDLRLYISGIPGETLKGITDKREVGKYTSQLPHIDASFGIWNSRDWDEMSRRMSSFLGFVVKERYVMPNFRSVIACLKNMACTAVCDARFGYMREFDQVFSIPLNIDTNVCCVWHKRNENAAVQAFVEHMRWHYGDM